MIDFKSAPDGFYWCRHIINGVHYSETYDLCKMEDGCLYFYGQDDTISATYYDFLTQRGHQILIEKAEVSPCPWPK